MIRRRRLLTSAIHLCITIAFTTFAVASDIVCSPPSLCVSAIIDLWVQPRGKIDDTFASYEQVEEINHSLGPLLTDILHNTDFFGYYRLNLYEAQCTVSWGDAFPMCGNHACAVDTLAEVL